MGGTVARPTQDRPPTRNASPIHGRLGPMVHTPRSDPALLDACDANLYLSNALMFGSSQRGEVAESCDLALASCGFPTRDFNQAHLKNPQGDVRAALDRVRSWFESRGLPYVVRVRDDREAACAPALGAAGLERVGDDPGMVLHPIRDDTKLPAGLEISEVCCDTELAAFQQTAFAGFGFPGRLGALFLTRWLQRAPGVALYLGRVDGAPACTSMLSATGHVAGIYWVATLPEYRRRGFGEAITAAAVQGGACRGCSLASLQASKAGAPVYRRMGFETVLRYAKYALP